MKSAICAAAFAAMTMPAAAATVTVDFEDVEDVSADFAAAWFSDEGFATVGSLSGLEHGIVALTDGGGIISTNFRLNRFGSFTPKSIDIGFFSQILRSASVPPLDDWDDTALFAWATAGVAEQAVIRFTGWLEDGSSVSVDKTPGTTGTVAFGSAFAGITGLDVDILFPAFPAGRSAGQLLPSFDHSGVTSPGQVWCLEFCVSASLDNLVADVDDMPAPVPLPAGIGLLGGALAMLGAVRRLRKGAIRPI